MMNSIDRDDITDDSNLPKTPDSSHVETQSPKSLIDEFRILRLRQEVMHADIKLILKIVREIAAANPTIFTGPNDSNKDSSTRSFRKKVRIFEA